MWVLGVETQDETVPRKITKSTPWVKNMLSAEEELTSLLMSECKMFFRVRSTNHS